MLKESRNTLTHLQVSQVDKAAEHTSSLLISLESKRLPRYTRRAFKF